MLHMWWKNLPFGMQFQTCFSINLTIKEKKLSCSLYTDGEEIFSFKDWFLNS